MNNTTIKIFKKYEGYKLYCQINSITIMTIENNVKMINA
mgnify:CR=1 FL=1